MGVLFEDEGLAGKLRRQFELEKSPDTSYELSLRHRRLHWRSDHHDYDHEPEAGFWRRALAFLVRYLPIESQL
jgi:putative cardiolipin synthase